MKLDNYSGAAWLMVATASLSSAAFAQSGGSRQEVVASTLTDLTLALVRRTTSPAAMNVRSSTITATGTKATGMPVLPGAWAPGRRLAGQPHLYRLRRTGAVDVLGRNDDLRAAEPDFADDTWVTIASVSLSLTY